MPLTRGCMIILMYCSKRILAVWLRLWHQGFHKIQNQPSKRFIIAFPGLKERFIIGCRPFLGIDGYHLKRPYGGVLLLAIPLDADCGIFPVAMCICEHENAGTWS